MKGNRKLALGKMAGAFALGATAGSTAALLLAPASGQVTRRRLASKFRSAERSASRQFQQGRKLLAKKAGLLKSAAAEKIGDTREWLLERMPNGNGKHHSMPRRLAHRS